MDRSIKRVRSPRVSKGSDRRMPSLTVGLLTLFCAVLLSNVACSEGVRRSGIPAGAQSALDTAIEDIDAGRYEKLYDEAADEWRKAATLDESKATLQKLHDKLGNVRVRDFQTAREEQTSTAPVPGHSLVVIYQTSFERGNGMETFTLLEHGGRWYLARYFVNSEALK
jgi:Protein of unknown function (DUF4019)